MFRLTTPDGIVIEVENERDARAALTLIRSLKPELAAKPDAPDVLLGDSTDPSHPASNRPPSAIKSSPPSAAAFAGTDGQRRLLNAIRGAAAKRTDSELAKQVGMTKPQMLGSLGALYRNIKEHGIDPELVVAREVRRLSNGRREIFYTAGPLLRGA